MKEITFPNIYPCSSKWFWYYYSFIVMKFSIDIKEASAVV